MSHFDTRAQKKVEGNMGDDTDIAELIADPQLEDELDGEADDKSDEPDAAEEDKAAKKYSMDEEEEVNVMGEMTVEEKAKFVEAIRPVKLLLAKVSEYSHRSWCE